MSSHSAPNQHICHTCRALHAIQSVNQAFYASNMSTYGTPPRQGNATLNATALAQLNSTQSHYDPMAAYRQQPQQSEPYYLDPRTGSVVYCARCGVSRF